MTYSHPSTPCTKAQSIALLAVHDITMANAAPNPIDALAAPDAFFSSLVIEGNGMF